MAYKNIEEGKEIFLRIDDHIYDCTKFIKNHPGGSVLKYYNNMDATDAFYALHERSEKARKWLKVLPKKKASESKVQIADDGEDALVSDFRKLREELKAGDYYKPLWSVQIIRCLEVLLVHFLALYVTINYSLPLGILLYGLTVGRNGLLMHDMGHRAFFGDVEWDKAAILVTFSLGITGSASFWNNQHNKHHAATQELEHDTDLITLPIVAFNKRIAEAGNPYWLRFQWIMFIPAQLGLFLYWKFTHSRYVIRTKKWFELLMIVSHDIIGMTIIATTSLTFYNYFLLELCGYMLGGLYLATVFSMNHTHKPVVDAYTRRDWVRRSINHTTDIEHTPFNTWLTGYLNYQIEHHLFPSIPHPRLPSVSKKVQALCKKHNVEYDCRTINVALNDTLNNLYHVGQEAYEEALQKKKNR